MKWWTRKVARQPEPEPEPQPEKVETGDTFRHGDEPPEGKVGIDLFNGPWHGTHLIHEPADTPDGLPTEFILTIDFNGEQGKGASIHDVPFGRYVPTDTQCENGHWIYVWQQPTDRRN